MCVKFNMANHCCTNVSMPRVAPVFITAGIMFCGEGFIVPEQNRWMVIARFLGLQDPVYNSKCVLKNRYSAQHKLQK